MQLRVGVGRALYGELAAVQDPACDRLSSAPACRADLQLSVSGHALRPTCGFVQRADPNRSWMIGHVPALDARHMLGAAAVGWRRELDLQIAAVCNLLKRPLLTSERAGA